MDPFKLRRVSLDAEGNVILNQPPGLLGPKTMSDDETYGQRQCASCSAAGCTLWCSACDITEIGKIRTFYCNHECQKKHRSEHKGNCTARVQVARAASILYPLYYAFEKATQTKGVERIAERNGVLTMEIEEDFPRAWTGGHLFVKFPEEALPAGTPQDVVDSILLDQACGDVATTCKPLVSLMLKPFVKSIHPASGYTRHPARVLFAYLLPSKRGDGGFTWGHSILQIRAGRSEVYALDLTAAQFGWKDILYDWSTYTKYRLASKIDFPTFAELDETEGRFLFLEPHNGVNCVQKELRQRIMEQYVSKLRNLLNEHFPSMEPDGSNSAITKLVKKKPGDFVAAKVMFLRQALEYPQEAVNGLGNVGRMYMSTTFIERVILTEEEAARYTKVWFEKGDPRVKELPASKLQALWRKRMSR